MHGVIVQLPLPDHLDARAIINAVAPEKDVDGFTIFNAGELSKRDGKPFFVSSTASGVLEMLRFHNIHLFGKSAVVVGRSDIVGMPMSLLLLRAGATVTICHRFTENLSSVTRQADILVVAAGKRELVGPEFVKPGAVVIDVGIHRPEGGGRLVGDVQFEAVKEIASFITPVPGGVGPMTVAMLLSNTIKAANMAADAALIRPAMRFIPLKLETPVPSDEEVMSKVEPKPISTVAAEIGVSVKKELVPFGHYKAKISLSLLDRVNPPPNHRGKLVVVTGVNPTKYGEGKTTVLLGLVQALNKEHGRLAFGTLRQPSQGPTFGTKGGAAGGGYSQVIPMQDVNLHLTGDIHAVSAANNLLCAATDTRVLHEGQQTTDALFRRLLKNKTFAPSQLAFLKKLGIEKTDPSSLTAEEREKFCRLNLDPSTIEIKRVLDTNDRFLRQIELGLGPGEHKFARRSGFDIAVASEVMAILALARDRSDLRQRLDRIVVGRTKGDGMPITAGDIGCAGAMAALLNDAIMPNLLQTLEGTPILMHAGPFANVAHGQNSVIADDMALRLAGPSGFCVTESGFGADMGYEKFVAIKSRVSGVAPDVAVIVVTLRAMRMHGEAVLGDSTADARKTLKAGCVNLERHVRNICTYYGTPVVVAINAFPTDTADEMQIVADVALGAGAAKCVPTFGWSSGSEGAARLAEAVIHVSDSHSSTPELQQLYSLDDSVEDKIRSLATKIYGASDISIDEHTRREIAWMESQNLHRLPICMAKTPLSFSHDPEVKGAPSGYVFPITGIRLSAGAGFIYPLAGAMQTMPGLSTRPGFMDIDVDDHGHVKGLF